MAARGILVKLTEEQAQEYANMGYVVMAAWKNLNTGDGSRSPHYATVRPGYKPFVTVMEKEIDLTGRLR